jgi:excisionase family DNA binding protein
MTKQEMLHLRLAGLGYTDIAARAGVSRQRVQQLLSPPVAVRNLVVNRAQGLCQSCGLLVGKSGHVHHIGSTNGDSYNDAENLQLLCVRCHGRVHPAIFPNGTVPASAAARMLGVCLSTIHKRIQRGALPAYRTAGGDYRIKREDVK